MSEEHDGGDVAVGEDVLLPLGGGQLGNVVPHDDFEVGASSHDAVVVLGLGRQPVDQLRKLASQIIQQMSIVDIL